MVRIKKEVDIGGGFILTLMIDDEIAIMSCNYGKELQKIYFKAKQNGKKIEYDFRKNVMIEKFPNINAEKIEEMIDNDIFLARTKQKEVIDAKKLELEEDIK